MTTTFKGIRNLQYENGFSFKISNYLDYYSYNKSIVAINLRITEFVRCDLKK
jgi:hypothetical protein